MHSDDDKGGLSIGQPDPAREQAMQQQVEDEQAHEGGFGADPFATPEEQRRDGGSSRSTVGDTGERDDEDDDYHPGQADQPDREDSDGLTGTGPAQP